MALKQDISFHAGRSLGNGPQAGPRAFCLCCLQTMQRTSKIYRLSTCLAEHSYCFFLTHLFTMIRLVWSFMNHSRRPQLSTFAFPIRRSRFSRVGHGCLKARRSTKQSTNLTWTYMNMWIIWTIYVVVHIFPLNYSQLQLFCQYFLKAKPSGIAALIRCPMAVNNMVWFESSLSPVCNSKSINASILKEHSSTS